jgi:hypothetical protein
MPNRHQGDILAILKRLYFLSQQRVLKKFGVSIFFKTLCYFAVLLHTDKFIWMAVWYNIDQGGANQEAIGTYKKGGSSL